VQGRSARRIELSLHAFCRGGTRKSLQIEQGLPFQESIRDIESEEPSGDLTDWRFSLNSVSDDYKMICPAVRARVEEADQRTALLNDRTDIAPFRLIAIDTSEGQVLGFRQSAMFLADNVTNFATEMRVILGDQAVFAAPASPRPNQSSQFGADVSDRHAS